jgi:hypothetical protein
MSLSEAVESAVRRSANITRTRTAVIVLLASHMTAGAASPRLESGGQSCGWPIGDDYMPEMMLLYIFPTAGPSSERMTITTTATREIMTAYSKKPWPESDAEPNPMIDLAPAGSYR